ncbi:MAG: DUF4142 domain-containing protein [Chitinophagaceae bacterium]
MKKLIALLFTGCICLFACNSESANNTTDSASNSDTATKTDESSTNTTVTPPDAATIDFLKMAADGGLAEVDAGKMAEEKASSPDVKRFASMMVNDHTGANAEVKRISGERNVDLPTAPSDDKKQKAAKLGEKKGKEFDKAYMDMMVEDHKTTIGLFEKAQSDSKDEQVKAFIANTLPKLKMHLDSAQAINTRVGKK